MQSGACRRNSTDYPVYPIAPPRYQQLDALRGMAALVVVLFHAWMTLPWPGHGLLQSLSAESVETAGLSAYEWWFKLTPLRVVTAGPAAVGLFFALSGLVLALPWVRGRPPGWSEFLIKRLFRLYLPFVVATFIAALLHRLSDPTPIDAVAPWFNSSWTVPPTLEALAGHLLMLGTALHMSLNNVMWSLVHEARISLLFPWLVVLTLSRPRVVLAIAAAVMTLLSAPGLDDWRIRQLAQSDPYWGVATILDTARYALYFVAGILIAARIPAVVAGYSRLSPWCRRLAWLTAMVLMLLQLPYFSDLAWVAGAVLLIALALSSPSASRVLARRPLAWLGRVSYSLYLIHLPILLAVVHLGYAHWPLSLLLPLYVLLSLLGAEVLYRLVEAPCQRLGHRLAQWFRGRREGPLAAVTER